MPDQQNFASAASAFVLTGRKCNCSADLYNISKGIQPVVTVLRALRVCVLWNLTLVESAPLVAFAGVGSSPKKFIV